jgi:hypothetical protein
MANKTRIEDMMQIKDVQNFITRKCSKKDIQDIINFAGFILNQKNNRKPSSKDRVYEYMKH